jgi:hypothetical protein
MVDQLEKLCTRWDHAAKRAAAAPRPISSLLGSMSTPSTATARALGAGSEQVCRQWDRHLSHGLAVGWRERWRDVRTTMPDW